MITQKVLNGTQVIWNNLLFPERNLTILPEISHPFLHNWKSSQKDYFEPQVKVISVHDSNKYLMLCQAEMSLPSLQKERKENRIPWRKFYLMPICRHFSELSAGITWICTKKYWLAWRATISDGLLACSGQQAPEKVAVRAGLDPGAPKSQICALNSSTFSLARQKTSLILPASV